MDCLLLLFDVVRCSLLLVDELLLFVVLVLAYYMLLIVACWSCFYRYSRLDVYCRVWFVVVCCLSFVIFVVIVCWWSFLDVRSMLWVVCLSLSIGGCLLLCDVRCLFFDCCLMVVFGCRLSLFVVCFVGVVCSLACVVCCFRVVCCLSLFVAR